MKRETLEEAAERLFPIILEDGWDKNKQYRNEWVEGAKWQQERSYSEEDVMNALHSVELKHNKNYSKIYEGMKQWFIQFKNS
jgi:hypothetical protein